MENPYRKLFNLFALSVLAFSVYVNFLHKEEEPGMPRNNKPATLQATMVSKLKPQIPDNSRTLLAREVKKN